MTVEYVDLADYIALTAEVTGLDVEVLMKIADLGTWEPKPTIDEAERAVLAIAAGDWHEDDAARWLRQHLVPPTR